MDNTQGKSSLVSAQEKRKQEESEAISAKIKKTKFTISDLIIPISVGIVLIGLAVFVFFPMINKALEYGTQRKEIEGKLETLEKLEASLLSLDDSTLSENLLSSKRVIPKTLTVSDFVFYVDTLAKQKNLQSSEISAGDVAVRQDTQEDSGTNSLGVSGPLSYTGDRVKIMEFLDEIQVYSPYLIVAQNIELDKNALGSDIWEVSLSVTGYYIPESQNSVDLYMPFTPYTNFSTVMDVLNAKAEKLSD